MNKTKNYEDILSINVSEFVSGLGRFIGLGAGYGSLLLV
jgi:hypothetical protein